ncbi:MAG: lytic transglycosylase domain-containing protein [Proteobacteria bacterium]|nr:lytic transglycosylase domain-containing protein [Pseudomonadota bacterium]
MEAVNSAVETLARPAGNGAISRAWSLAQAALALVGLVVLVAAAHPVSREAILSQAAVALRATEPPGANFSAGPIQPTADSAGGREQRAVTEMLAKRYRVAQEAVGGFVAAAYRSGKENAVDPLLILAVISVESRFNPVAESAFGAKGLMQIIPKFHKDKLVEHGGDDALLDPEVNIQVGAEVLREYIRRFGGTETALQAYAGAFEEPNSFYAKQVLSERSRLEQAVSRLRRS